jgi:hypothetical protein
VLEPARKRPAAQKGEKMASKKKSKKLKQGKKLKATKSLTQIVKRVDNSSPL